ncbi:MAG: OmpA family protein, partial [Saprospiraceae bacterium]
NLGATVNTSGNEVFPYVAKNDVLYFSSNSHGSMGGLDIFRVSPQGEDWTAPQAMMTPINSISDDLTFMMVDEMKGYFASARTGGNGGDDIWEWTYIPPDLIDVDMIVVDARNDNPLGDANITVTPVSCQIPLMNDEQTGTSGDDGKFAYQIYDACTYKITVTRAGYQPFEKEVSGVELRDAGTYKVPLTPLTSDFKGFAFSTKDQSRIPGASIVLVNLTTGEETTLTADENGEFTATLICTDDYEIRGSANQFKDNTVQLPASEIACEGTTEKGIGLEPNPPTVLVLQNIYYNFDKCDIRPDAAARLDKLIEVMTQYPSLEIDLRAHTDARGSNRYNERLSQCRVQSALEYITSRGIASSRVGISSAGEIELTNECANGKRCTEEEHQRNRRTIISVRRFNADNMRIQIIDNPTFPDGAGKRVYRVRKI